MCASYQQPACAGFCDCAGAHGARTDLRHLLEPAALLRQPAACIAAHWTRARWTVGGTGALTGVVVREASSAAETRSSDPSSSEEFAIRARGVRDWIKYFPVKTFLGYSLFSPLNLSLVYTVSSPTFPAARLPDKADLFYRPGGGVF
jgi:hypothetical protein